MNEARLHVWIEAARVCDPFTALVMLAEIGGAGRFGSARKLASWAGLTGRPRLQHALLAGASPAGRPVHVTEAHRLPG